MAFGDNNKINEYMFLRYHINNEKLTKACQQHIVYNGLLHQGLSHEEIQEKIKEYKTQYALKKKMKAEKELRKKEIERQMFIYGYVSK